MVCPSFLLFSFWSSPNRVVQELTFNVILYGVYKCVELNILQFLTLVVDRRKTEMFNDSPKKPFKPVSWEGPISP